MAWTTPQTAWTDIDSFQPTDMERVEQNIDFLGGNGSEQQLGTADNVQHANLTVDDITCDSVTSSGAVSGTTGTFSSNVSGVNGSFSGALSGASVNTGHGAAECYDMDQPTRTTDGVTFATVNTGQGNNEVYPMNQPVRTTDSVTHANISVSGVLKNAAGAYNPDLQSGGRCAGVLISGSAGTTDFPVGTILLVTHTSGIARNGALGPRIDGSNTTGYQLTAGTLLTGSWQARGSLSISASVWMILAQRTA